MKVLRLLAVAALFFGCTTTPVVPALPKVTTKVSVIIPGKLAEINKWVSLMSQKCAKQLEVEEPPIVKLFYMPSPSYENGSYILGLFIKKSKEIHIWLRHPHGFDYPLDQAKNTFYHEFLHWYDDVTDQKFWKDRNMEDCPIDHNDIFNERIKNLNWS